MIKIIKLTKEEICSCNSCNAQTYTPTVAPKFKTANQMYEIIARPDGGFGHALNICDECLSLLLIQADVETK